MYGRRIEIADAKDVLITAPKAAAFIKNAVRTTGQKIVEIEGTLAMAEFNTRRCLTAVINHDPESTLNGKFVVHYTDDGTITEIFACDAVRIRPASNCDLMMAYAVGYGQNSNKYIGSFNTEQMMVGECIMEESDYADNDKEE